MRVLLDTTALYVSAGLSDLAFSRKVQTLLEEPGTQRLISPISLNEIAIKANRGLTPLTRAHVETLIRDLSLTILPVTAAHSLELFGLPGHHADPFDRMLIATALAEDIALVACDREFKKYAGLRVIW